MFCASIADIRCMKNTPFDTYGNDHHGWEKLFDAIEEQPVNEQMEAVIKELQKIARTSREIIETADFWNEMNPGNTPIDCEPDRIVLRFTERQIAAARVPPAESPAMVI